MARVSKNFPLLNFTYAIVSGKSKTIVQKRRKPMSNNYISVCFFLKKKTYLLTNLF